ncbi:MAG: M50 family metallopeptidase [Pseudomonadota bacterium]
MGFLKGHWQLFALIALVFALWPTPVILPLKILTVFLHELSHGLAAILTGGSIVSLSISPEIGGLAVTRGGNRFVILNAGYLGSLVFGALILLTALRTNADKLLIAAFGILMIAIAALYMREMFALAFCLGTGALMLASARYLPRDVNDLALRLIGLTSVIYVPFDIFSDTIARSHLRSDARLLSEDIGGPTVVWGALWLILSLIVIGLCLRYALGRSSNLSFSRRSP